MKLVLAGILSLAALPALAAAQTDDIAPMALNSLSKPPANIGSAEVMNPHGQVIGQVAGVVTDAAGKPLGLRVAEAGGTATIDAAAASYDAEKNIVITDTAPATGKAN